MSSNSCQRVSTQSLRGVGQNKPTPNAYATYGSLGLGHNMSCGVPILSIFLHPEKKRYFGDIGRPHQKMTPSEAGVGFL